MRVKLERERRQLRGKPSSLASACYRPIPARRCALELSDVRPGSFTFRIHEAAVRDRQIVGALL
jgi:hypothetical protein